MIQIQLRKSDIEIILSALTTLIATVISDVIPGLTVKLLFILFYMAGVITFLLYIGEENTWKRFGIPCFFLAGAVAFLVGASWANELSGKAYMEQIAAFFRAEESRQEQDHFYYPEIADINDSVKALAEDQSVDLLEQDLSAMNLRLVGMLGDIEKYRFWESKKDPGEVAEILDEVGTFLKDREDFSNLNDRDTVELLYKMRIAHKLYHYKNILAALEAMGIDCEALEIDEYTLVCWDTEKLFSTYNMRKELEDEWAEEVYHERFDYEQYKVRTEEYSDTFDYGNWGWSIEESTNEAKIWVDKRMMEFYRKFKMNFSQETGY